MSVSTSDKIVVSICIPYCRSRIHTIEFIASERSALLVLSMQQLYSEPISSASSLACRGTRNVRVDPHPVETIFAGLVAGICYLSVSDHVFTVRRCKILKRYLLGPPSMRQDGVRRDMIVGGEGNQLPCRRAQESHYLRTF